MRWKDVLGGSQDVITVITEHLQEASRFLEQGVHQSEVTTSRPTLTAARIAQFVL